MAQTLRHIALSVLILFAGSAMAQNSDDVLLEGISLRVTSGTLELQHVVADEARYEQESGQIGISDIELSTRYKDSPTIQASSSQGEVMIGGYAAPNEEDRLRPLDLEEIRLYGREFTQRAVKGDLMLRGGENPARAIMGDIGSVISERMIWSDRFDRIILPSAFEQQGVLEDGTKMRISGSGLYVDPQLRDWTYFADEDAEGRVVFTRPAEGAAPDSEEEDTQ